MEKVKETVVSSAREFNIPLGLLKEFQADIRILPKIDHPAGYIMFDLPMLISVLRGKDVEKARELASELEKMGNRGGELVIMQR